MNDTRALAEIQRLARLDRVVLSRHARLRMEERDVSREDVVLALVTATAARAQDSGAWRVVGGYDVAGEELTVIVDVMADVVVITIF